MKDFEKRVGQFLEKRRAEDNFRSLQNYAHLIDLSSNDYIGLARSGTLYQLAEEKYRKEIHKHNKNGATGSRLISGHTTLFSTIEKEIAHFHQQESALIFNSGYVANVGLISCVARKNDRIIYDELIHASMHDGMRMSKAASFSFKHNDLHDLEQQLSNGNGQQFVLVESLYSMDGDEAPLKEMAKICAKYDALMIVDEAHAIGVKGLEGRGLVYHYGIQAQCLATVVTYGKAMGCHGAAVLGPAWLKAYLINFCRSFIFSTAMPLQSLCTIQAAYDLLPSQESARIKLQNLIYFFNQKMVELCNLYSELEYLRGTNPIQILIFPDNKRIKQLASRLQGDGFNVRAILSPTVPIGKERIRICLHAFNSENEIDTFINSLNRQMKKLTL